MLLLQTLLAMGATCGPCPLVFNAPAAHGDTAWETRGVGVLRLLLSQGCPPGAMSCLENKVLVAHTEPPSLVCLSLSSAEPQSSAEALQDLEPGPQAALLCPVQEETAAFPEPRPS